MAFTIALAQCDRPSDGDVAASVRRWAQRAADAGADLLVFPEALMTPFEGSVERFAAQAQPADGPFAQAVDAIAAETGLWIAYTMNERNPGACNDVSAVNNAGRMDGVGSASDAGGVGSESVGSTHDTKSGAKQPGTSGQDGTGVASNTGRLPFNTAIITNAEGRQQARYRKVHLFDAQGERESTRMAAGDELMRPVHAPFACIGLGICYDLRFPEVATAAALQGAQLMLYPAAWVAGPRKVEQWETLLAARAIENGMFVAGADAVYPGRAGHSCVFGPDGTRLATSDEREQLVTCTIDLAEIERVRTATPSLQHRRPSCYRPTRE